MSKHSAREIEGLLRFLGTPDISPPDIGSAETEEAIKAVLEANPGRRYCGACLAQTIGVLGGVKDSMLSVAGEYGFRERFGRCYDCRASRNRRIICYNP